MKTKDLMIGDWVHDDRLNAYTKVEMLTPQTLKGDIHITTCPIYTFKPIPLTPEILEKNGWKPLLNYDRETYYSADGAFNLLVYNGKLRLIVHSHTVILEYIHQLQHALRLCGLTELADNFKI